VAIFALIFMKPSHDTPHVLVADDETYTTLMLQRIFERDGYIVSCVNDGVSALEQARKLSPDLILLDIQMPGMTGFDVLKKLREETSTASIPTILITAKARHPSDVEHGLNLGADDYMNKPFDPRELLARARSKIQARRLEENLQRRTQELQALLRISQELSQYLEVEDLAELIPSLALGLLPGDIAILGVFDEEQNVKSTHVHVNEVAENYMGDLDEATIIGELPENIDARILSEADTSNSPFQYKMIAPLDHRNTSIGFLFLASNHEPYDEDRLDLLNGLARQASLALRNAQLYEVQMHYAMVLEETVNERTSELKSTQQMLIQSEKLASIGRLAASIAHEINNPLQPIRSILDMMVEDAHSNRPVDIHDLGVIQESVERIRRIVSQLLEVAGRNSTSVGFTMLDVKKVLEQVISLNRKLFQHADIALIIDIPQLPEIYGNKDQLEQVFMNLMLNARDATMPGGRLAIKATHDTNANEIVLVFSDTGQGIKAEDIDNIFDPFFSSKPNGTGLGLFVTYGIVQGHDGRISVESEPGQGTTFTITLPCADQS